MTNPVASLFDSVTGGPSAQSTIASLQQENAELRAELSSAQLSKAARQQLSQLLQLDAGGYRIMAATVIAAGGDYSDTVTLDVGPQRRDHDQRDRAQRFRVRRHRHRR